MQKIIKKGVKLSKNLISIWQKDNLEQKQATQNMVFPDDMLFDFKNKISRNSRTSIIFESNRSLSSTYGAKKERDFQSN